LPTSDDDRRAFADAIHDVQPLPQGNRAPQQPKRPPARAHRRRDADAAVLRDSLEGAWHAGTHAEIEFARPGVPPRVLHRLKRGLYSVEAEIDLHGMSRLRAQQALHEFLVECVRRNLGCVRIIHGKGMRSGPHGPVLKDSVRLWLAQWDEVMAYASADHRRGGDGAVCALLRGV
jgi:DNA-nicking Smr family endonuclease